VCTYINTYPLWIAAVGENVLIGKLLMLLVLLVDDDDDDDGTIAQHSTMYFCQSDR
jgi:hypothetical protein